MFPPIGGAAQRPAAPAAGVDPEDPRFIRDMFLANRDQLALLKQNNPRLAEALLSGDLGKEMLPEAFSTLIRIILVGGPY